MKLNTLFILVCCIISFAKGSSDPGWFRRDKAMKEAKELGDFLHSFSMTLVDHGGKNSEIDLLLQSIGSGVQRWLEDLQNQIPFAELNVERKSFTGGLDWMEGVFKSSSFEAVSMLKKIASQINDKKREIENTFSEPVDDKKWLCKGKYSSGVVTITSYGMGNTPGEAVWEVLLSCEKIGVHCQVDKSYCQLNSRGGN